MAVAIDESFLLEISRADTIHDWAGTRIDDVSVAATVKKYLEKIGINKTILPSSKVVYSNIEDTYTEYVVDKDAMTRIEFDNRNTLDLTPAAAVSDFNNTPDTYGCKSMRVIWSDRGDPNTPIQFTDIGKKIFNYFGVSEYGGELHLIVDANSGKLTSQVYDKDIRFKVNVNALNIADSAPTRVTAPNIVHNYFPFNYGTTPSIPIDMSSYPKTGIYELKNWSLAHAEMDKLVALKGKFIYAHYTNVTKTYNVNLWKELPFNEEDGGDAGIGYYHISMRVGITNVKGDIGGLVSGTTLWESSFVQKGDVNIKTTQGAGINSLSDLIKQIDDDDDVITSVNYSDFDLSPILNDFRKWLIINVPVTPSNKDAIKDAIKRILVSFIFDYKRSGDHEQVLSCKLMIKQESEKNIPPFSGKPITYVLSTGDQLCALWARKQGVSCIWHHAHKMDMYSFSIDKISKRRDTRLLLVTTARNSYDIIRAALDNMKTVPDSPNVYDIVEMHKIVNKDGYMELESVVIYNKYLTGITDEINDDTLLLKYYEGLIDKCNEIIKEIYDNILQYNNNVVDTIGNGDGAKIKTSLDNEWLVPLDKYASFIAKIILCPLTTKEEWAAKIDPGSSIDIFGFTLLHHIDLSNKYNSLKDAHGDYNQKIFNAWPYKSTRDRLNLPNERPKIDNLNPNWINQYKIAKEKYDGFTASFLRKNGAEAYAAIFVGTTDNPGLITNIWDMNYRFNSNIAKIGDIPDWYERVNCHNTGGRYYGIGDIATWLEDTKPPEVLDLTGVIDKVENNHNVGGTIQQLPHPENLEKQEFYNKYNTGLLNTPSKWLIDTADSMVGGGAYDDDLTPVSAPKFIDYIESIRSNILFDLNLECVGDNVNEDVFQKYIIKSVKNLYLKYNQSDYDPLHVYNLLKALSDSEGKIASIYRYTLLIYDKIYPDMVESGPFPTEYNTNEELEYWNQAEMAKIKIKKEDDEKVLNAFIPKNKNSFWDTVTELTIYDEPSRAPIRPSQGFRSSYINTENILKLTISNITVEKYLDILKYGLYENSCKLRPRRLIHSSPLHSQVRQSPSRSQVSLMHIDASKPPLKPKTGNYTVVSNLGRGTKRTSDNRGSTPKEGKHINPLSRLSESSYKNKSPNKENINKMSTGSYNDTNAFFKFNSASPIRIEPSTRSVYKYLPKDAGYMDVGPSSIGDQSLINHTNKRLRSSIRGGHKYTTKTNRNKVKFNFTRLNHNKKHKINYTRKHNRNVTRKHKMHRKQTRKHRNRR